MDRAVDRRRFLKQAAVAGAGVAGLRGPASAAAAAGQGAPNAEKLGWHLGCAAYTFNRLTFVETIDKVAALGLHHVEPFEWQRLSKQKPKVQTNASMAAGDRKELKKRLADAGVKLASLYCRALSDEGASRRTFEFAKDMGIATLVAEPPASAFDFIEKLCDEYQISLAVHNHPQPSGYWHPDRVLAVCKGRGKRIGACCDTGHWVRSGIQPVDALKKMAGRITTFHLKDVKEFGVKTSPCVPFGMGKGDIKGIMQEVRRQGLKDIVFGIEYEPYRPTNFDSAAQCVAYFDKVAAELLAGS